MINYTKRTKCTISVVLIGFSLSFNPVFSQQEATESDEVEVVEDFKKTTAEEGETVEFFYFEIPSALNGSYLDPSPISNVTANFTESKYSLKLGLPSLYKDVSSIDDLVWSGFVQGNFKASNGLTTIYKTNNPPVEFGGTAGVSRIVSHNYWHEPNNEDHHTSEEVSWFSLTASIERNNFNLFDDTQPFGSIKTRKTTYTRSIFLSFNRYFWSELSNYRWSSVIYSIGAGVARANNYGSLKKRTYEVGKLIYNADSTQFETVVEATAGAIGTFQETTGFAAYGEMFIPLVRNRVYGSVYFGNRLSVFGYNTATENWNAISGFYFTLKDRKPTDDKPAKDIANFSLTAQFLQVQQRGEANYVENNFSVVLQASIPLRFN